MNHNRILAFLGIILAGTSLVTTSGFAQEQPQDAEEAVERLRDTVMHLQFAVTRARIADGDDQQHDYWLAAMRDKLAADVLLNQAKEALAEGLKEGIVGEYRGIVLSDMLEREGESLARAWNKFPPQAQNLLTSGDPLSNVEQRDNPPQEEKKASKPSDRDRNVAHVNNRQLAQALKKQLEELSNRLRENTLKQIHLFEQHKLGALSQEELQRRLHAPHGLDRQALAICRLKEQIQAELQQLIRKTDGPSTAAGPKENCRPGGEQLSDKLEDDGHRKVIDNSTYTPDYDEFIFLLDNLTYTPDEFDTTSEDYDPTVDVEYLRREIARARHQGKDFWKEIGRTPFWRVNGQDKGPQRLSADEYRLLKRFAREHGLLPAETLSGED